MTGTGKVVAWLLRATPTDDESYATALLVDPDDIREWARLIGAADGFDVVSLRELGLLLVVDDRGLLEHRPVNAVATLLAHAAGRWAAGPLVGDVLVFGVDSAGETVNAPLRASRWLVPLSDVVADVAARVRERS